MLRCPRQVSFWKRGSSILHRDTHALMNFGESPAGKNFTLRVWIGIDTTDPLVAGYRFTLRLRVVIIS
jgi:hypothetical protein